MSHIQVLGETAIVSEGAEEIVGTLCSNFGSITDLGTQSVVWVEFDGDQNKWTGEFRPFADSTVPF